MTENSRKLSIIIPVYNEAENVEILTEGIRKVMLKNQYHYEIIFINDGSKDNTLEVLTKMAAQHPEMKVVNFRMNYGQTAAMSAGIDFASGQIIIPMDGDNQNDPEDIPRLIAQLDKGFDVVSGWRKNRQDKTWSRVIPSKIANWVISHIGGVKLHDYGCSLKAYKTDVIKHVKLYGEMHRFIPIYAAWQGGNVTEMVVNHHPRKFGKTKYGINRTFKVILDLLVIKYLEKYLKNPIHFFGGFGLVSILLSGLAFLFMLYLKYFDNRSFIETPMPLLVILFFLVGILSLFIGLLAEIQTRTYFESQDKRSYTVRNTINF